VRYPQQQHLTSQQIYQQNYYYIRKNEKEKKKISDLLKSNFDLNKFERQVLEKKLVCLQAEIEQLQVSQQQLLLTNPPNSALFGPANPSSALLRMEEERESPETGENPKATTGGEGDEECRPSGQGGEASAE